MGDQTGSTDARAAADLLRRLRDAHPEWADNLRLLDSADGPQIAMPLPQHPGHRLDIVISASEATVTYDDGAPPGPAERLLTWHDNPLDDGLDSVMAFVAALARGEVIIVRERLPRVARWLRRNDRDSQLWFVSRADFDRWPNHRRRRVKRAWTLDLSWTLDLAST